MEEVQNYVGEKNIEQLELVIFPSEKSEYTLYEDNGKDYEYETGKYSLTKFTFETKSKISKLDVTKLKDSYKSDRKNYLFTLVDSAEPKKVRVDDKVLPDNSVKYDSSKNILQIKVADTGNFTVQIDY